MGAAQPYLKRGLVILLIHCFVLQLCPMLKRRHITIYLLLWFIFSAPAALAENLTFRGHYDFTWSGIPVGKIVITVNETDNSYRINSYARTKGIIRLFSRHKSKVFVEGARANGNYLPLYFHSKYMDGDKQQRSIEIRYNKSGDVITENISPPKRASRPEVPAELKKNSVDILTSILALRQKLSAIFTNCSKSKSAQKCKFYIPIFDGKRRFDLWAEIIEPNSNFISAGTSQPAIKLQLWRVPIAGFRDKELKRIRQKDVPVYLFINPQTYTPLGLTLHIYGATLAARLEAAARQ